MPTSYIESHYKIKFTQIGIFWGLKVCHLATLQLGDTERRGPETIMSVSRPHISDPIKLTKMAKLRT
jgi:hypothetical protein